MERLLKRNIWIFYLHAFLASFMLFIPYLVLFATESLGMTYTLYMITEIAFNFAVVLFEVPTGVISDKFTRKLSWMMGSFMMLVGGVGFVLFQGFWSLLLVQIVWALHLTFHSGSNEALIYDSLKQIGQEEKYPKVLSKSVSMSLVSVALSAMVGGFLLNYTTIRGLMWIYLFVILVVSVLPFFLTEPEKISEESDAKFFQHIKDSVKVISKNHYLLPIVLFMAIVPAFTKSIFWLFTPIYLRLEIPEEFWGSLNSFNVAIGIIVSYFAGNLLQRLGVKKLITFTLFALIFGFFTLFSKNSILVVLGLALANNMRHFARIAGSTELNKFVDSNKRATVLSLAGLLVSLIFSIGSLISTFILDTLSFEWTLGVMVFIYLVPTILISSRLIIGKRNLEVK